MHSKRPNTAAEHVRFVGLALKFYHGENLGRDRMELRLGKDEREEFEFKKRTYRSMVQ
jgi:hypothetical protein